MVEIYSVEESSDKPVIYTIFDAQVTSMDYISSTKLVVSDVEGNIHILSNILDKEQFILRQVKTKFNRIRQIQVHFDKTSQEFQYLVGISTDARIGLWDAERVLNVQEDLEVLKANRIIQTKKGRLTCLTINNLLEAKGKQKKLAGQKRTKPENAEENAAVNNVKKSKPSKEEEVSDISDD